MDTIFLNHSENVNLADKITEWEVINMLLCQILTCTMHGKTSKYHTKTTNFKYQFQHGINHFIYLMDQILYQIFKIILNIY